MKISLKKFFTNTKLKMIFSVIPMVVILMLGIWFLTYFFYKYIHREGIQIYEVIPGEIMNENKEEGFIFRTENVINSNEDGYVTYYAYDTSRIQKGSLVCSISKEKNDINDIVSFIDKDYKNIKNNLAKYISNINKCSFYDVYDYSNKIVKYIEETKTIRSYDSKEKKQLAKEESSYYAQYAGLLSYFVDGYESFVVSDVNKKLFDKNRVIELKHDNLDKVKKDDPLYKVVTNSEYQIAFLSKNDYSKTLKEGKVLIQLPGSNVQVYANIGTVKGADGELYYMLSLDKYLEDYIDNRIIDFSIVSKSVSGLKIPLKSILYKNCYKIPKSYLHEDPLTREKYLVKQGEDKKILLTDIEICREDEENIYFDVTSRGALKALDNIVSWDQRVYSIREVAKLPGVYNINKGYSVFKYVDILDQTSEYAIIRKGANYSLSSYDHIVLDQSKVEEGSLIS